MGMGRPRAFDEDEAVAAAAALFAERGFEGTSVDDLVQGLGVHRGSLYKVFGSKRGLYLAGLRRHLDRDVLPLTTAIGEAVSPGEALAQAAAAYDSGAAAGLLLFAAAERAPGDPEVAGLVAEGLDALEAAIARALARTAADAVPEGLAEALAATVLGLRLRGRASGGAPAGQAVLALTAHLRY